MKNIFVTSIVGAGGTGSGKTTIVNQIINNLTDKVCVVSQNTYYSKTDSFTHEKRIKTSVDHLKAIDLS